MLADVEAGIGVVVLVNGMSDAEPVAELAPRAFVTALAGETLPDLPAATPETDVAELAGLYRGEREELTISVDDGRLSLLTCDERIVLEPMCSPPLPDAFVADHPDLALFPLRFGRDGAGGVVELMHERDWYATDAYEGSRNFEWPTAWAAYAGHYRSYNPWVSNFRIVIRKGELLMISPSGAEQTLTPDGDGFRLGDDPQSPERISFDTVVDGAALRARLAGGAEYYRFFTP